MSDIDEDLVFWATWVFMLLINLAFYGTILWVIVHFTRKFW